MTAVVMSATRAQSVIQRAYVYAVALVAIHMIVLGVANILRVLAEIAVAAPSGGFTGLRRHRDRRRANEAAARA